MLGFVLLDDGMTHIAKRNRYFTFPNIQIDSIISYGFNDSLVIALVNDTRKEKYFVISDGSKNIQLVPFSQFNVINIISKYNLNWIDNVNSPPSYLIMGRFFCGFLLFFSIICLIIYMVKMIKRKKGSVP